MTFDFSGRTALVTGDASGIGRAVTDALRAAGATVIGIDRSRGDDVADPEMWLRRADGLAEVVRVFFFADLDHHYYLCLYLLLANG